MFLIKREHHLIRESEISFTNRIVTIEYLYKILFLKDSSMHNTKKLNLRLFS